MMRGVYSTVAFVSAMNFAKMKKRKPFNPMLGETYELVTEKFRYIAEKCEHIPRQITCFELEG